MVFSIFCDLITIFISVLAFEFLLFAFAPTQTQIEELPSSRKPGSLADGKADFIIF